MIPVVLSGGSGTRLWPISRAAFPKQFHRLLGEPLVRRTLARVLPLGQPRVLAVAENADLTRAVLADLDLPPERAIYEPEGRNTAPAVALLCRLLELQGRGEEVVGLFPADHLIEDEEGFRAAARLAEDCAREGWVSTIGIRPTRPATGYGYIETTARVLRESVAGRDAAPLRALAARAFHEKPDAATAEEYLARGNFFWNAGIFVFRVAEMARHLARWMPGLWGAMTSLEPGGANLPRIYAGLPRVSLDVGVMEHLGEHACVPAACGWSDLGSWDEVVRIKPTADRVFEEGSRGNFVLPFREKVYGLVGVEDLIVVDTADALLVARQGSAEGVRSVVEQLRSARETAAVEHAFEERPWGGFEVLREAEHFKSKIIRIHPHHQLSYQSHRHRREHWIILRGHPEVVLDDRTLEPGPGDAILIPQGAKHRIRNPTEEPVEFLEVQLGSYFGEDDITRYEDDYGRT